MNRSPTSGNADMRVSTTDADLEMSFTYTLNDTTSTSYVIAVDARYVGANNRAYVRLRGNK